jgi:hypothetical protein
MNDEGLADVEAASPFRLPRLHPGIAAAALHHRWPLGRGVTWPDNDPAFQARQWEAVCIEGAQAEMPR